VVDCAVADVVVAVSKARRGRFEPAALLLRRAQRELARAELELLARAEAEALAGVTRERVSR
jgi:hypothetical protein